MAGTKMTVQPGSSTQMEATKNHVPDVQMYTCIYSMYVSMTTLISTFQSMQKLTQSLNNSITA